MPQQDTREGERIAKLLARAGVASRREVERMIAEGRVKLGEDVITTPNTVLTSLRGISVDGKPVKAAEPTRLFGFHKPDGLITAERDPAGRPTIYTALRNALPEGTPRVMPVGRLDFNTEGLLLLTNDGELKRALELPSTGIPRTYRARTFGEITQAQLEDLIEGVTIDGIRYGKINANMERSTGRNQWIEMTITEGKNREVRRVLEHLGLQVSRLIRIGYGPYHLGDLPRGGAVEIRQVDVERFRKAMGLGPSQAAAMATQRLTAAVRPSRATAAAAPAPGKPTRGGRHERPAPDRGASDRGASDRGRPAAPRMARAEREGDLVDRPRRRGAGRGAPETRTAEAVGGERRGPARSGPAGAAPARDAPARGGPKGRGGPANRSGNRPEGRPGKPRGPRK